MIRAVVGGLIGFALTILFGVVVIAFVVKAFMVEATMANQLLNSAITVVGTTLGAVLGYFLGKNSNRSQD
jgi:membrane protein YqaA with SNARE-associated domain